jgi:hypothetical protein|nr:MAG TPA: hypothetical protein [Crassvirales sp.]
MKIKVLLTKEQEFEVREQDLYNLIIRNIEANGRDQHNSEIVNQYLYLIPDMIRVAISDRFNKYYKDNYDIFSLKDQIETVNEAQEQVLSIHKEKMEEYNERMRKREETNKAHQHYNDLLKKLPKPQRTAFGPLYIESVDDRGINLRHENGKLYGIKEDREDGYFDFSGIKEDLPFLKGLRFYLNLKNIEDSIVQVGYSGVKITPDNGPSIFIPLDYDVYNNDYESATIGLTYNDVMVASITI